MYLVGASGHAKVIINILEERNILIDGLFDRDNTIKSLRGYKVYSESQIIEEHELLIAIGDNFVRKEIANKFRSNSFGNAIHYKSIIDNSVKFGCGIAVMAGGIINADTKIGDHSIINTNASVDHDCQIGKFVHIGPNATICGGVIIGDETFIGAGSTIIPGIRLGKQIVIGAGTIITKDIPDGSVVVGVNKIIK